MTLSTIQQETTIALECELLMANHERRRCEGNARAFALRASLARDAGRESDAADNEGSLLYWRRMESQAACHIRNLEGELARRLAGTA